MIMQWLNGQTVITFEAVDDNTSSMTMVQQYSGNGIVQNAILFLIQSSIEDVSQSNLDSLKKLIEGTEADEMNGEIDY